MLHCHFAYKLAGAVSHVCTCVLYVDSLYHPLNVALAFVGVHNVVIFPLFTVPVNAITAHVHPFGYTFIV
ncbi:hypothetical protein J6V86_00155 [bacterium]|nr:hypothetical protein [bacterium]